MTYTMKQAQDCAARKMINPILDFLEQKDPSKSYIVKNVQVEFGDGHGFGEHVTIYKKGAGLLRKIFPKRVATINFDNLLTGRRLNLKSFDELAITQGQLESLLKGVDFKGISFSGAVIAQGAIDYN